MEKITMKEKVLRFVESKGTARFTEIQKFIVNTNYGEGTYDAGAKYGQSQNPYRGYYSAAFYKGHSVTPYSNRKDGYFLRGDNRLEKQSDGSYKTIRNTK